MSVASAMPARAQVTVVEDRSTPGGGYAVMRILGVPGSAATSDTPFWLRRIGYERNNLGAQGWQGPECPLQPVDVMPTPGGVDLLIGPEVVDVIEVGTPIEIAVPSLGVKTKLIWPEIAPSVRPLGNRRGSRVDFGERRAGEIDSTMTNAAARPRLVPSEDDGRPPLPPLPGITPEPAAAPDPGPEHEVEETTVFLGKRPALAATDERPRPPGGPDRPDVRPSAPGHSAGWLVGLILFLLAVAAGAAAYWFYGDQLLRLISWPVETPQPVPPEPQPPTPPPTPHPTHPPVAQPQNPPPEPTPPEPPVAQPQNPPPEPVRPPPEPPTPPTRAMLPAGPVPRGPLTSPIDFARGLLADNPSPERALELAQFYLGQNDHDVALLLLEHAADGNNGPAMTAIGRMYDPVQFNRGRSAFEQPNPVRAADWYRRAQAAGDPGAQQALDALRAWLDRRVRAGDPDAQQALRQAFP